MVFSSKIESYIKLARPHHYIKNGFVFLPLFFGYKLEDPQALWKAFLAFAGFCLAASSAYVFNDIQDVEEDRRHPQKKVRPLASAIISKSEAFIFLSLLLFSALSVSALLLNTAYLPILGGYLLLNFVYSLGLRHISILDIAVIAFGFVLRVLAGSVVVDVRPSQWIILMTFLLALFLSLSKRREDLLIAQGGNDARKSLDGYNIEFVTISMVIMASVIFVTYILYTVSPEVISKHNSKYLFLTSFWVITGILRFMQLIFVHKKGGSPTEILLQDLFLQAIIILWLLTCFIILYVSRY
jgi:decaprenyl-phosphate phosphoribosyltransferase